MILARFFRYIPTSIPGWLKYLISGALLFLLLRHIDWRSVGEIMLSINVWWLFVYAIVILAGIVISAYRWHLLAQAQGFDTSLWRHTSWYITSTFLNNFLPGFLGGDAFRAYMLGRTQHDKMGHSIFVVLVDRAVGLFAALLVAVIAGVLWLLTDATHTATAIALLIGAVIFLASGLIAMRYRMQLIGFMARRMPKRYAHYGDFATVYTDMKLWHSIFFGVIFMLVGVGAANYILFLALGITPAIIPFLFFAMIASIISAVPISIGNIGVKEWAYVTLFALIGVQAPVAVAVVIIGRIMQALLSCLGIPLYLAQDRATRQALHNKKTLSA